MRRKMDSLRGKLLVSSPKILDPNFRRTVVLIAEHTDEGAMGFVLNRPAAVTVGDAVPDLAWLADSGDQIHVGGPVAAQSVIVLAEFDDPSLAAMVVMGDLGFIPAEPEDADALTAATRRKRVFAGHAGWGPDQLEAEVEDGSWIIVGALPDDAFCDDPDALWRDVLDRAGGRHLLMATLPMDPSLN
jgi:putative transcriptional regulator